MPCCVKPAGMPCSLVPIWMPKECSEVLRIDSIHLWVVEIPRQRSADLSPLVSPAAGSLIVARGQGFGVRLKVPQEPLLTQFLQSFLLSNLWVSVLRSVL